MTVPSITLACGPYDRIQPLATGEVGLPGFRLDVQQIPAPMVIFSRMLREGSFDLSEMSLTHCYLLHGRGKGNFLPLPVFPSRMFRHGYIYVNGNAGIRSPEDLAGKRIGVQGFQMTAAVWIRTLLRNEYGVDLDGVRWVEGGVNEPGVAGGDTTAMLPEKQLDIINIGTEGTLSEMLEEGAIDALIGAVTPRSLKEGNNVRRLFPEFHREEADYYRRTGIFPIMHALVIRNDSHAAHPTLAAAAVKAMEESKAVAQNRMRQTAALSYMLPWLPEAMEELDNLFGGDFWPYGLEANQKALEAFGRALVEDGYTSEPIPIDRVFPPFE